MIKFILQRPIAVLMAFTACVIIGIATYFTLPISLLPDIAIPEITIQISEKNTSARELENTVVKLIRAQLLQVARLRDIRSEVRDGSGVIRLKFDYGTNTDLAFIEVNEKIDASMNYLPRETERPRVIKASATDIPVLYVNLTLKENYFGPYHEEKFLELSELADQIIKRRIEQLQEVAMVDGTGFLKKQIQIIPDISKMEMLGISTKDLENILVANNVEPGHIVVKDGHYQYSLRFSNLLRTREDIENIYIRQNDYILQLKDIAQVHINAKEETGSSLYMGKRAITLSVIKQADENMDKMKEELEKSIRYFSQIYPEVEFNITRNQTELLDYTISNLQQNLTLGLLFIFFIAILFLGDMKSPFIIGVSMLVALVISFIFFYLFKTSLNIISLSGLILAQGMMIDNSIIVTENIAQYRERGFSLEESCRLGTTEVITPMLSSSLTTIAVFIPLVFLSGIAGAIFYDEAFGVTVGLISSYITGIILLPVLYQLFYRRKFFKKSLIPTLIHHSSRNDFFTRWYEKGVSLVFTYNKTVIISLLLLLPLCFYLFYSLDKSRMPEIEQTEFLTHIEWNEHIHVEENRERVNRIFDQLSPGLQEYSAYIGAQQFMLKQEKELTSSEAELYIKTDQPEKIKRLQKRINEMVNSIYPDAILTFSPPENIFEKIFVTGEADIVIELYTRNQETVPETKELYRLQEQIKEYAQEHISELAFEKQLTLSVNMEKLLLYKIPYQEIIRVLKTALKSNEVTILRSYQQYIPVTISGSETSIWQILKETLIKTSSTGETKPQYLPLQEFVKVFSAEELKTIHAGRSGEYIPFKIAEARTPEKLIAKVKERNQENPDWEVGFSGAFFANKKMIGELVVILFISLLLMYFILAAQFESFRQPLIILLEIPIDITFALFLLWLTDNTLNLMSAIGIVVSCGIIINDSILKLAIINQLRKEGKGLIEAIHEGGKRRLRAIIMTSLTTIFAMVPLLFSKDIGSALQQPLAIAIIGTMGLGTLVSLFIIPLIYWLIYKNEKK